jgi:hypothetical protein
VNSRDGGELMRRDTLACLFCGEPEHAELFEVWGHEFMIRTCCEAIHEQIVVEMNDDPAWARHFMRSIGVEDVCGSRLRRVTDDGCAGLILDWKLALKPVPAHSVRSFIARNHAHCGVPVTWRFHQAVYNGATLIGVAVVGNPVAPALMHRGIVEVNRLCVRRDLAAALRWNAASMLYGWCAREAELRGWQQIITYTRADEPGTSLTAAGWKREATIRGRGWHSGRRRRSNRNSWIDKVRWSRPLAPTSAPPPQDRRSTEPCAVSTLTGWTMDVSAFG